MGVNRSIKIIGDITIETYGVFSEQMDLLEADGTDTITIELCSDGGTGYAGIAFHDRIQRSPCEVHVNVIGTVMSAATAILAAADYRTMTQNSWFMVHDDSVEISGFAHDAVVEARQTLQCEDQWASILADGSNLSKKEWRTRSKKTTYMTAQECLQAGIIEAVV